MKEDLESISQTTAAPSQIAEFNKRRAKTPSRRAKHDQNASKICIFCQKTTAYKKGARICDPLSAFTCVSMPRLEKLASRHLVAGEAWYHSQCYRDYTPSDKACKYSDLDDEPDSDETNFWNIKSQASEKLYEFIRLDLLENPRLVKKVELREKLMIYMRSMGATEISESTKKHFGINLEKEFGDLLQLKDLLNNNKLFVLPKNLSKVQLAREVVTVSHQLENRGTPSKVKEI